MPRRDALSEEKRKRLMLEHEHLQQLMLQARSTVRRSSMKERAEEEVPEDSNRSAYTNEESIPEITLVPEEKQPEISPAKKEPLTEKELFQKPIVTNSDTDKRPLTETDLFRNTERMAAPPLQKSTAINVILPEPVAAAIEPDTRPTEERYNRLQPEETPVVDERVQTEGDTLYDDGTEIKQKNPKRLKNALLLAAALVAAFIGYYFYQNNQVKEIAVAKPAAAQESKPVSQPPMSKTVDSVKAPTVSNASVALPQTVKPEAGKEIVEKKAETPIAKPMVVADKKTDAPAATANASLGKYKVISKAYFHNEPDESTRRKAFMTHWDDAVLTPMDEKNGFIYITFTNYLGQTSKGWLRKSDLKRIQ